MCAEDGSDIETMREFEQVTEHDVISVIREMETKSSGSHPMPTYFLKNNLDSFITIVTKLVNISLAKVTFTHDWKYSILRPLLKGLSLDLVTLNYRPVPLKNS